MSLRFSASHKFGSAFLRRVAVLTSGNVLAVALPILAAPIIGRLYAPADYAALSVYMAFSTILNVLGTLQFQQAIISEKNETAAKQVAWLCLYSSIVLGILTLLFVVIAWPWGLSATAAGSWLWMLPVSVGFSGIVSAGSFLSNRMRDYRWLATVPVIQVVSTLIISISLGFMGWESAGLLTAYFIGQLVTTIAYLAYLLRAKVAGARASPGLALRYAHRHRRFPAFTLPSSFLAQLNLQMPIFVLTAIGDEATLGSFTRARQLASLPVSLLGGAIGQVFRREAAEMYHTKGDCRSLMVKTALGSFVTGILPVALFVWTAPWLFTVYLGPAWSEAGELAQILAPMLLLRLIASPLTTVFQFTGHQKADLRLMLLSTVILAVTMAVAWANFETAQAIVAGFSIGFGIIYLIYLAKSIELGRK